MTIPFLTKTQYSLEIDGAFSNNQLYDLTIGTNSNYDICVYQSCYEKLNPMNVNQMDKLIELGYLTTKKYKFNKKKKHNTGYIYTYKNIIIIVITWFLKFLSFPLKIMNIIE